MNSYSNINKKNVTFIRKGYKKSRHIRALVREVGSMRKLYPSFSITVLDCGFIYHEDPKNDIPNIVVGSC